MKTNFYQYLFIFLVLFACKKAETESESPPQYNIVGVQHFESTDVNNAEIVDFLDDFYQDTIIEDSAENIVDMEFGTAMYLLEAAENTWLRDISKTPYESALHTFSVEVDIYIIEEDDRMVEAANILAVYSEIYRACYDLADEEEFNDNELDKFILSVDLEWSPTGTSSTQEVDVTLIVANEATGAVGECSYDNYWYAIDNAGGCNLNPATSGDATTRLTLKLNWPCNWDWNCSPGTGQALGWKNIETLDKKDSQLPPYPDMWYHCYTNECLTNGDLDYYHAEITDLADYLRPKVCATCGGYKEIHSYVVTWTNIPGNCSPELHRAEITYGECLLVPEQATLHPPIFD